MSVSQHVSESDKATAAGLVNTLEAAALSATRAAALAAQQWVGRGDGDAADEAATEAMREVLSGAPGTGSVVIGEGEKDKAPMLYNGEELGTGEGPEYDIAVDPIEGTSFCAKGLPGAIATIAFSESGCMWSPGPAFYMDKLVVPPAARGAVNIDDEPEQTLEKVADAIGKKVEDLRVVVLDKPRHEELIERLLETGAAVHAPPDGDVAGALDVLLPTAEADILMGIGGTPEGAMTACAARALGGGMLGRLAPQKDEEREELEQSADHDLERVYDQDELVASDSVFVGTGISGGSLLRRPWGSDGAIFTESILITRGTVRRITEMSSEAVPGLSSPRTHAADGG